MISVIIPTYKRKELLDRALSSIKQQSYQDTETIVIDDDSDPSVKALIDDSYHQLNIKYIKSRNIGGAKARNLGIEEASGEYIAFLDDDDYYHNDKLKSQHEHLEKNDADVVICGSINITTNQELGLENGLDIPTSLKIGNPYSVNLLAKSELIKKVKFDEDLPNAQDWDLLVRLLKEGAKFSYIDKPLLYRDAGDHSRITNSIVGMGNQTQKRVIAFNKHRSWLTEKYYKFRCAKEELAYISVRKNKLQVILKVLRTYGFLSIVYVLKARFLKYI
jgi:glycosyltransferase involved in cell wall biosynthesis